MTEEDKVYFDKRYEVKYRIRYIKASELYIGHVFYHDLDSLMGDSKRFVYEINSDKILAQCISKTEDGKYCNNVRIEYDKNDDVVVRAEVVDVI